MFICSPTWGSWPFEPKWKKLCSQFDVFVALPCCQLEATGRRKISDHVITRPNEVGPATERTQMRTAQDIVDDLSFFEQHLHPFAYALLLQNWVWSCYAVLRIRSNAEIVCHEQTVLTRVAGDIQSSSRRNSGSRRLVLKPLDNKFHGNTRELEVL